jgi:hypothetical protein
MVDDAERVRVREMMHAFRLDWNGSEPAAQSERPLAKVERLKRFYLENPCVASPLLLKSLGIDPERPKILSSGNVNYR